MQKYLITFGVTAVVTVLTAGAFIAPAFSEPPTWRVAPRVEPASAIASAPEPMTPDGQMLVTLVRTSLLSLNDAVRTGNFTVLRDSAATGFRNANTAARLSVIFAKLTEGHVDLSPVAVLMPQLDGTPMIDAKGMLNIRGHYLLAAARVDFALIYERGSQGWTLFGILVQPNPLTAGLEPTAKGFETRVQKAR